ncbi:TPA: type VI secretion system contractile sheath large subunit, partial [Serratia marcescens]
MRARQRRYSAKQQATAVAEVETQETENELDGLLKRSFRPRTNEASEAVRRAIGTLSEYANKGKVKVSQDVVLTIESLIAQIDEQLSQQMNNILHHKEFQKLESAWQGLSYLVDNTNVSETLKIRVLNISQDELTRNLRRYRGSAWDQSPVFKQIYEQEYGQFGGEPFGCIIGDFEFDHSPMSVTLLTELAKISAASHCPFISAASPSLLQMSKWNE